MAEIEKALINQETEEPTACCCHTEETRSCECRTKHREEKEYRDLQNRLKRIEGQVRGIQKMVEEDRYCIDIMTQVSAVQSALNSFNKLLLTNHIQTCVVHDIREGQEGAVEELCTTIQRMMR
ncbi:MAG: metal-sensing transcriptional repressor [Lachnospiraceae bacterium]|uniref:metal-sensing transcriptional repressor n=1 Tax=Parablautia sp. Marseille-Q6255 TaxID=3039593 RepID=UPI0024BBFCBD|nr:metal-sensing transcriptional repressor [Parablautia sp. Marseille-Q6255]